MKKDLIETAIIVIKMAIIVIGIAVMAYMSLKLLILIQ